MLEKPPPLDDDSEDLTDTEVENAIPTKNAADLTAKLFEVCPECSEPIGDLKFALRRRKPTYFSRVTASCRNKHPWERLFTIPWFK